MKKAIRASLLAVGLFVLSTGSISAFTNTTENNITAINAPNITPRENLTVELNYNGEIIYKNTQATTIYEFLGEQGIELDQEATLNVDIADNIVDGLKLEVNTTEIEVETTTDVLPFETVNQIDDTLEVGRTEIISEGIAGIKETTTETVYFGGELVEQVVLEENIVKQPQPQVISVGTKEEKLVETAPPVAKKSSAKTTNSIGGYTYVDEFTMEATAYIDEPGSRWYNITASGMPTFVGMVAVDRNVIPLGTILYVDGYGLAIAGDVGGAIDGYDIDLFMNSYDEAMTFGRRDVKVYLLADQTLDVQAIRYGE